MKCEYISYFDVSHRIIDFTFEIKNIIGMHWYDIFFNPRLSAEQISKLNDEFCRGLHGASEAQIGGHIRIADAVASLQGDPRTKSIGDRLASFRDSDAENAAA